MSKMRFLWAAALVALCVGLMAGGALAAPAPSWNPTANNIPAVMIWDQPLAMTIDSVNDGTVDWATTLSLVSTEGPTTPAVVKVNRWGVSAIALSTVVPTGTATHVWSAGITAPAISTFVYADPTSPTNVAVAAGLACKWMLADSGTVLATEPQAGRNVVITRFNDATTTSAGWGASAVAQIEACAGRIPVIVKGYGDGTYRPDAAVTRDYMAVYMQRALDLPSEAYRAQFTDVTTTNTAAWARSAIEACAKAGIVQGYPQSGGTFLYAPGGAVTRDQMAVYIARGMAGGEANVPVIPTASAIATFTDVPSDFWAFNHIEYCVDRGVVKGYTPTSYVPDQAINRGQMAVFVYRAFIQPSDCAIVMAGPAVTSVDASTAAYDGWSSIGAAAAATPGTAYIGFDAMRVSNTPAPIVVVFTLKNGATVADTTTVTLDATQLTAAKAAVAANASPYVYATWELPTTLTAGTYTLETSVNGLALDRKATLRIQ